MNAINHAATALVIKKYSPNVPLLPILISVQFIELLWVILNITGIEYADFSASVASVADVHLVHMPFSHSLFSTLIWAAAGWFLVTRVLKRPSWGIAIATGILSHIVLDLATHARDIEIIPFIDLPEMGSGIYLVPLAAFVFEMAYSVFCWWIIKGDKLTLAVLLLLNLLSISLYVPAIAGPESYFASYPELFAPVIGVHIIFGFVAIWGLDKYLCRVMPNRSRLSTKT